MTAATERLDVLVTPLCPVHVGTGEDFDPTDYVIDDEVLYHFDAAALPLDDADRQALLAATRKPGDDAILALQRFFHERTDLCKGAARSAVAVVAGVQAQYLQRIGKVAQREQTGSRVANRLEIERTSHHPHTGLPYLPGSSLKGAMRTAWLDRINGGEPRQAYERAQAMETRLLDGGAFHTDPFRLLAIGDATGENAASQVFFSTNHKKRYVARDGQELPGKGPSARRECLAPAQFAALATTVAFDALQGLHKTGATPLPQGRIEGWNDLARACNRYYRPRLERELALLDERRFVDPQWLDGMRRLVADIDPALESGHALLLRVGRHSGAENVTLDGVREIRIMRGRGQPAGVSDVGATTLWLAAHHENDRSGMQPFGWLLLHLRQHPLPALQSWCANQPGPDLHQLADSLADARRQARERAGQVAAEKDRRAAQEAQTRREAEEAAARLQALTDQGRAVEELRALLMAYTAARKQPVGGQLYGGVRKLVAQAEQGDWAAGDRADLAQLLRTLVPEKIELGGKAKEIKQTAARLAGGT